MTDVSILYDRSETDELGIRLTAEQMGIELGFLPFHKAAVGFGNDGFSFRSVGKDYTEAFGATRVVLNRTQSKSRRIFGTTILEALGVDVLNSQGIEIACQSKIRTLLAFYVEGIKIPETVYVSSNAAETLANGRQIDNRDVAAELIEQQLGGGKVVIKPDAGTHGKGVTLADGREALLEALAETGPSVINPSGVVAQELVPKWFYDLRILVEKRKGERGRCFPTALVRAGFKDFRTNTYLGNMVFRCELPEAVKREATRCGEALSGGADAWVLALDAMPYIGEDRASNEGELRRCFDDLMGPFEEVKRVKADPMKLRRFEEYSRRVENAYHGYMATEAYAFIQGVIQESLDRKSGEVLFHECNSCPEFWEQTRIVGGVNLAESLLCSALSLLDR